MVDTFAYKTEIIQQASVVNFEVATVGVKFLTTVLGEKIFTKVRRDEFYRWETFLQTNVQTNC